MFKKSIYITILSFIVSIISFCNQLLIAYFFGAKEKIDLFFSITSFPLLLGGLLNISFSYFLIPHIKKQKLLLNETDFKKYLIAFFRNITTKLLLLFIMFGVIVILYQKFIALIPFTTSNAALSILALLTSFFLVLVSILTAFNNAEEKYITTVLVSFLPPICSIILLVFLNKALSTLSIQIGLLAGAVLGSIILIKNYMFLILVKNENKKDYIKTIKLFYKQMSYVIIAMLSFTVYQTIDAYWGSKLGTSNVSYLGYLQRLIIAIGIIVISGPSVILVPKLTEHFVKENKQEFIKLSIKAINWVFILSALFALVCSLLSKQIIQLLFQRAAFTQVDTNNMSQVFPHMLVGMCFMLSFTILFRILFINNNAKKSSFIGLLSTGLYFLSSGLFSHFYSLKGICIAYLFTWIIIFFIAAYYTFKQYSNAFFNASQLVFLLKIIFLSLITVILFQTFLASKELNQNYVNQLITIVWKSTIVTMFFVSAGIYIFKINELKEIINSLRKFVNNSNKNIINE